MNMQVYSLTTIIFIFCLNRSDRGGHCVNIVTSPLPRFIGINRVLYNSILIAVYTIRQLSRCQKLRYFTEHNCCVLRTLTPNLTRSRPDRTRRVINDYKRKKT